MTKSTHIEKYSLLKILREEKRIDTTWTSTRKKERILDRRTRPVRSVGRSIFPPIFPSPKTSCPMITVIIQPHQLSTLWLNYKNRSAQIIFWANQKKFPAPDGWPTCVIIPSVLWLVKHICLQRAWTCLVSHFRSVRNYVHNRYMYKGTSPCD